VTPRADRIPVLPLRDLVFFPAMVLPLLVGRRRSVAALQQAMAGDARLLLLLQRDADREDPMAADLHPVGTVVQVLEATPLADGTWRVVFEGLERVEAVALQLGSDEGATDAENCASPGSPANNGPVLPLVGEILARPYQDALAPRTPEIEARIRRVFRAAQAYVRLHPNLPDDLADAFGGTEDRVRLLHLVSGHLTLPPTEKQHLLEVDEVGEGLNLLSETLDREIEILRIEEKLDRELRGRLGGSDDELRLSDVLGMSSPQGARGDADTQMWAELEASIAGATLPPHARTRVDREFSRLVRLNPASPEAGVIRGYLEWVLDLPWAPAAVARPDVRKARALLSEAHYGLDEVKDRILDYLAVVSLVGELKGPILCLVGPPGVGKTSLAQSMARAMDRPFVRVALGGVRDEAEIRGHRRTYVGSMPGRILQGMRRAGTRNPVFLLDEVDKITKDAHGDPASALLEVLDPEQNHTFQDHYLELDFDLSDVLFVATANTLGEIPEPLRDRMEVIRIPGYLETEKRTIAASFLAPAELRRHGLDPSRIEIPDASMAWLIQTYTREAGVRALSRTLARMARKLAREVAEGERALEAHEVLTPLRLRALLGPPPLSRLEREPGADRVGVATGLAWTSVGGELLEVEVAVVPGSGKIQLTGTLGDVMKESAVAALTYARSRAQALGLRPHFHQDVDIHVHIPEGATPKDGPSAGITMATALISALTGIPTRDDVAMTGELTLRGRVLSVGGIREKVVAALRHGIQTVLIPDGNAPELETLPDEVRGALQLIPVRSMDEVLSASLRHPLRGTQDQPDLPRPDALLPPASH